MPVPRILVIGASGTTGGRVGARLEGEAVEVIRASRSTDPPTGAVTFDWFIPSTYAAAVDGVDAAYVIPPPGEVDPQTVMTDFFETATRAGLRRVVLLGAQSIADGDAGAGRVQHLLPSLVSEWAVLQPSWFMQNLLGDHHLATSLREAGVLRTAAGSGRLPFVDADDIAAVACAALLGPPLQRSAVITGPEALTYDDVAQILAMETQRAVRHESLPPNEMRRTLSRIYPAEFASVLVGLDERVAKGEFEEVTDEVAKLSGRPAKPLSDFARRYRSQLLPDVGSKEQPKTPPHMPTSSQEEE